MNAFASDMLGERLLLQQQIKTEIERRTRAESELIDLKDQLQNLKDKKEAAELELTGFKNQFLQLKEEYAETARLYQEEVQTLKNKYKRAVGVIQNNAVRLIEETTESYVESRELYLKQIEDREDKIKLLDAIVVESIAGIMMLENKMKKLAPQWLINLL